jgi:uncharacterized protein
MDTFLIIAGISLLLASFAGSVLPFLPGPPLAYISLVLLQLTGAHPFSTLFLVVWAVVIVFVVAMDYYIPIWGTKRFGGTKGGSWGATIGLVVGLIFMPAIGIIVGPFLGAFVGELINGQDARKALRSAIGSFAGFLAGTLMKLAICFIITYYFIRAVV